MKFFSTTLAAIAAASMLVLGAPQADAGHKGKFKFTSKAPKEDIFGTATGQATLSGDIADITTVKGSITVPVKTMETGNTVRDDHLRGPDWLDERAFPISSLMWNLLPSMVLFPKKRYEGCQSEGLPEELRSTVSRHPLRATPPSSGRTTARQKSPPRSPSRSPTTK